MNAESDACTVKEFIADVLARSHLKPITVRRYAVKLRKMAADIAKLEAGLKGKALRSKFDYVNGGRERWLAKVEGLSMGLLTTEAVSLWRNQYVAKAGCDPIARKSAERSGASYTILSGARHEDPAFMSTQMTPTFEFLDKVFDR